jgi:hypothetical protein
MESLIIEKSSSPTSNNGSDIDSNDSSANPSDFSTISSSDNTKHELNNQINNTEYQNYYKNQNNFYSNDFDQYNKYEQRYQQDQLIRNDYYEAYRASHHLTQPSFIKNDYRPYSNSISNTDGKITPPSRSSTSSQSISPSNIVEQSTYINNNLLYNNQAAETNYLPYNNMPGNESFHQEKPTVDKNTSELTKSSINNKFDAKLQDTHLWKQFNKTGTEMIITKSGRRMFPSLRAQVSGLDNNSKYLMIIDIIPVDDNRYKYHNGEWVISGKAEAHFGGRGYLHPDSPLTGNQWSKQVISFHKMKLTNNPFDRAGHIILNSMHKYVPRLHIIEEGKSINTFVFNEATFMAVTAYQNETVIIIQIDFYLFKLILIIF